MIRVRNDITPPQADLDLLSTFQSKITGTHSEKSTKAKKAWDSKKKNAEPFIAVKAALTQMCAGARRCMYCEDSVADEIEHFRPKDLFPDHTFRWDNYLYACGPCNGPKNNKFAIYAQPDAQFTDLSQPPYNQGAEPPPGEPVLLNPRIEDPLHIAVLDLAGTFYFRPLPASPQPDAAKRFTYNYEDVLALNKRDYLVEARKEAYGDYKARILYYRTRKAAAAPATELDNLKAAILRKQHPTVFQEIQRWQRQGWLNTSDPELAALLLDCPEILNW